MESNSFGFIWSQCTIACDKIVMAPSMVVEVHLVSFKHIQCILYTPESLRPRWCWFQYRSNTGGNVPSSCDNIKIVTMTIWDCFFFMIFFQVRHVVLLEVICHGMKDSPQCLFVLYAAALHLSRADKLVITLVILGVVTVVCRLGVHVRHDCSDRMDDYFPPMALASPAFTTPTSGVLRQPEPSTCTGVYSPTWSNCFPRNQNRV